MTIYRDTTSRGTPKRPQFVTYLKYGDLPLQEVWLNAGNRKDAVAEAASRFSVPAKSVVILG